MTAACAAAVSAMYCSADSLAVRPAKPNQTNKQATTLPKPNRRRLQLPSTAQSIYDGQINTFCALRAFSRHASLWKRILSPNDRLQSLATVNH
jgi:hypothetical protein